PTEPLLSRGVRAFQRTLPESRLSRVTADPAEALLAAAILGGFGDYDAQRRAAKYNEFVDWLGQADAVRNSSLDAEPWRYVPWFGAEDTVYSMAVHLDTARKDLYQVTVPPRMSSESVVNIGVLAQETSQALRQDASIAKMLAVQAKKPRRTLDLCELIAVCGVAGDEDLQRLLRPPTTAESARVGWHLERIQDEMSDACHRGARALQGWLTAVLPTLRDEESQIIIRTLCSAWVACGVFGCQARTPAATTLGPHAYSDRGEIWGRAFVGVADDKVYQFAVTLDFWGVTTAQEHQALLRAIIDSAGLATLRLSLPDLLELGTGLVPLPSPAFYEAVIELGNCAAERIRADLSEGWMSQVLKALRELD